MAISVAGKKTLHELVEVMTRVSIMGDERDESGRRIVIPAGTKTKLPRGVAIRLAYGLVRKVELDPAKFDDAKAYVTQRAAIREQKRSAREAMGANAIIGLMDRLTALEGGGVGAKKAATKKAD